MVFVEQLHDVTAVEVSGEYRLRLTFDDGTGRRGRLRGTQVAGGI
jgi:DUF971 family protein